MDKPHPKSYRGQMKGKTMMEKSQMHHRSLEKSSMTSPLARALGPIDRVYRKDTQFQRRGTKKPLSDMKVPEDK